MQPTILYEVSITVDPTIRSDYLDWLTAHMDAMLKIDGFLSAQLLFDTENENAFICHYWLRDMGAMSAYLDGPAQAMRADGTRRFGDKMKASRRILTAHSP